MSFAEHIVIRQSAFEEFKKYAEIYHACFGVEVDEKYFLWKYFNNPAGRAISMEAWDADSNRIAAVYSIMPEYYFINGQETIVYQSFDTMTHPDYRGRGLFVKLAKLTYDELLKQTGSIRLIGIPGTASFPGFVKKLQWISLKKIPYLFLPKGIFILKSLLSKKTNNYRIEPVKEFNTEHDNFFFAIQERGSPVEKKMSSKILNWKIFQNPILQYEAVTIRHYGKLAAMCIYKIENKKIFITFLNRDMRSEMKKILITLCEYLFSRCNANCLFTWEPTQNILMNAYRDTGFLKNTFLKGPFSYRVPVIFRFEPSAINGINMYDINNYNIQPIFQD